MSLAPAPVPALSPAQPVPVEYDLLCEGCGYSLLGLFSDRCPECGRTFDPAALPLARVPWLYRARLGRLSAYVQTVWMIHRRPRAFAAEMCRPVRVSADDAKAFRRATIRIVIAVYLLAGVVGMAYGLREMLRVGIPLRPVYFLMPATAVMLFGIGLWAALGMATDMPTFIWRGLPSSPDDLGPLHHYACAPLALAPLIGIACGGAMLAYDTLGGRALAHGVAVFMIVTIGVWLAAVWWIPPVLMRAATRGSARRMLALAAYLPVHWLMMLALGLGFAFTIMMYLEPWMQRLL